VGEWDIKTMNISFGSDLDEKGFLKFEFFNDSSFGIYLNQKDDGDDEWHCENIDIEVARRLKNFLVFALDNIKIKQ